MQSGKYRYVGVSCRLGDTEYDRLGQYAEFDETLAKEVLLGGGKFLHEDEFDAIFTASDCALYPYVNGWPEPPQELKDKRKRALAACDAHLSQLEDELKQASK